MKAWQIENLKNVKLEESVLQRKDGEVKIKLAKVAMSSTDLLFFADEKHTFNIPGHSAVAYVSEADEDSGLKLGSRVVVSPYLSAVEHGVETIKTMGVDVDGLLQDFACLPQENVFALPDGISDEEAIFAEYIAMGNKVFASLDSEKGDYIVIVGASTLGLILGQLATYYQMVPILVDMDAEKLAIAEKWDIYYTLNPTYDNLERKVEQITGGRMSEVAIIAGESVPLNTALRLVKNEGQIILAGYVLKAKQPVDTDMILKKQLVMRGVCNGDGEMSSAINLLANKAIHTEGLIDHQIDFEDFPKFVDECVKYPHKFNKVLVNFD
ncbi:MAG: zinc-binding dehydrogenase [Clostridia bacterium]|nr:zinc-binding dehydrogenase [Clostridia bacterium]